MKDCRNFKKSIISVFSFAESEIEVLFNAIAELLPKVPQISPLREKTSQHMLSFFSLYVDCGEMKIQVQCS